MIAEYCQRFLAHSTNTSGRGQQLKWALETFKIMQQRCVVPDVLTYNALISAWEKGKQLALALKTFEVMR